FYFFFQAEDGIRDFHVTGVQTCALPICDAGSASVKAAQTAIPERSIDGSRDSAMIRTGSVRHALCSSFNLVQRNRVLTRKEVLRSEERRVGKECRSRGAAEHGEQKWEER